MISTLVLLAATVAVVVSAASVLVFPEENFQVESGWTLHEL